MKRSIIIAFAFLISMTSLLAQNMDNPKVQQMRKEFYGEKLDFTAEESEAFWPIFEKYQAEQKALKKKCNAKNPDVIPDSDIPEYINDKLECEEKKVALKKEYVNKFMTIIPSRKVALIDQTERQFKQNLLKKYKQRQGGKRPNGR